MNNYCGKNALLAYKQNTPLITSTQKKDHGNVKKRRYTKSEEIDNLAIDKYHKSGRGITYTDLLSSGLAIDKKQAQDTLKHFCRKRTLFTLKDQRPQRYYPSSIRSTIIEKGLCSEMNNLLLEEPTGVSIIHNKQSAARVMYESINIQTLEGYILPMLPLTPLHIHNVHLKTKILTDCYAQLNIPSFKRNRGKFHSEYINKSQADFVFYPNGTVEIQVKCSENPHKLETEEDRSRLLTFFGQLKDRLIMLLMDKKEKIVPDIMEWYLTECDINKDINVSDLLHFSGLKIQVRHIDHIFRVYIKSVGPNAICRVEETRRPNKPAIEAIDQIFNPLESLESQVKVLRKMVTNLEHKIVKIDPGVLGQVISDSSKDNKNEN